MMTIEPELTVVVANVQLPTHAAAAACFGAIGASAPRHQVFFEFDSDGLLRSVWACV